MESSRYSHGGGRFIAGLIPWSLSYYLPPLLSNDVRDRETENPALLDIEYPNHKEKGEEKKREGKRKELLRRINETARRRHTGGRGGKKTGRGWSTDVGGRRARKRGLQEFNLDEFFLATYYQRGGLVKLSFERRSNVRPSRVTLARVTSIQVLPRKHGFGHGAVTRRRSHRIGR